MKHLLPIAIASLTLVACVDTTGLSAESLRPPHPDSNPNGVVTVTEFADLQCPACKGAQSLVVEPLIQQYGDRVRFEFAHFPLVSIHRYAMEAAEATECAADQGKFWQLENLIYERQEELSTTKLTEWGKEIGLDEDLYMRCRKSHIKRDLIQASYDAGKTAGVTGTPTFFVNGVKVESTIQAIGAEIEKAQLGAGSRL